MPSKHSPSCACSVDGAEIVIRIEADARDPNVTDLLQTVRDAMVQTFLTETGGDKKETARLMGVSLKTVYNWLNHLPSQE